MFVIENGKTLYVLSPMQFLDSAEWFEDSGDHFYQVINTNLDLILDLCLTNILSLNLSYLFIG